MKEGRSGSVTQWIFAEHLCKCEHPQPMKVRTPGVTFKSKAFEDDDDDPNESALDLDDDLFPTERYKPLQLLGQGALGQVYLCRDLHLRKKVALKSLFALTDDRIVSFQQEAKTASRLSHEKVIKVFDFGTSASGRPYMVMEYFPGRSLQEVIGERGFLEEYDTCIIFLSVCEALSHLHEHGIFHRDLKPSNILMLETETGEFDLRLIDFGLSKTTQDVQARTDVQGKTVVGTPCYMSPDQASGLEYDARSEIYSLGCIMYEALAGQPPFSGDTSLEILNKHMRAEVPPLLELAPDVTPELCAIVEKCLNKKPEDRYRSTIELADAIANVDFLETLDSSTGAENSDVSAHVHARSDASADGKSYEKTYAAPYSKPYAANTYSNSAGNSAKSASNVLVGVSVLAGTSALLFLGFLIQSILTEKPQHNSLIVRATFDKDLDLRNNKELEKSQRAILKQRMKKSDAKKMDLRHACVDDDLLLLSGKPSLTEVDVSDSNVSDRGIENLVTVPHLQVLNLTRTRVKTLSEISKLKRLRYLTLDNTAVDDNSLKALKGLELKYLSLGETLITDSGISVLANLPSLQILILLRNNVGPNVVKLAQKLPRLSTIDVRNTRCKMEDVVALANANKKLDSILISGTEAEFQTLREKFPTIRFKSSDIPLVETWGLDAEKELIKNNFEGALKLYEKALDAYKSRDHEAVQAYRVQTGISYCLSKLKRYEDAEKLQQKLVSEFHAIEDKDGELGALKMYALTLLKLKKFDLADQQEERLFKLSSELRGANSQDHRETQTAWASACFDAGRYDKSAQLARTLRSKFQNAFSKEDPRIGALMVIEATSLEASHKPGFLPLYKEGLEILHSRDEKDLSPTERARRQSGELCLMRNAFKTGDWKLVEELSHIFLLSHEEYAAYTRNRIEVYTMRSKALENLGRAAEAKTSYELLEKLKAKASREKTIP